MKIAEKVSWNMTKKEKIHVRKIAEKEA